MTPFSGTAPPLAPTEKTVGKKSSTKPIPVEVKQSPSITNKDLKGIYQFLDRYNAEKALVITEDLDKTDGRFQYLPLWKWLLQADGPGRP